MHGNDTSIQLEIAKVHDIKKKKKKLSNYSITCLMSENPICACNGIIFYGFYFI